MIKNGNIISISKMSEVKSVYNLKKDDNFIIFVNSLKKYLLTTRFSKSTWNENILYRQKNPKIKCIYCSPVPISKKIKTDSLIFVLEMNNEENKIMGIGLVRNNAVYGKYKVYHEKEDYNKYVYAGNKRINREDFKTEEEKAILEVLETLCFKGKKNLKRGTGLKLFPLEYLFKCYKEKIDIVDIISGIFRVVILKKELSV